MSNLILPVVNNTKRLRQNGGSFADHIFKWTSLDGNNQILIASVFTEDLYDNCQDWFREWPGSKEGDKPLSEVMMA